MARISATAEAVTIHLARWEKVAAMRGDVSLPAAAITAVAPEPHPYSSLRGVRAPGTGFPGVIAYGVRRRMGGRDFAAVLGGGPAIRIDLDPGRSAFGRVTVSVPDAAGAIAEIAAVAGL